MIDAQERLVYGCAGCADVGELADQVARKLRRDGSAMPSGCLTGVGAGLKPFIDASLAATEVVAVDGCPVKCAKLLLERAQIPARSVVLTDFGLIKGKTSVTPTLVQEMAAKVAATF